MELDNLKPEYHSMDNDNSKSIESLNKMKYSGSHPVLKGIKKQLVFEGILWTLILIVFYDFFDGHLKAFYWNVLLVMSILLVLLHNVLGFIIVRAPINDSSIKDSLRKYLNKIKSYSRVSIISRVLAVVIFMGFLTSNVVWDSRKIWTSLVFLVIMMVAQVYFLNKVWRQRVKKIENQIDVLEK
ncbi:hypothetical protein [Flavivirga spongiicola]|uniref:Uncharacterized protein n=1 Tax=Flavivirga spongiicola TaxID=421621 RepID=A0ABU7XRS7_9FLAO|nr:hypothetical protein [Flavivirga sp. MEBiC05379]MDO5978470.1 hypothetical protein [Flavivirga sp. MEBiC05379]